MGSDIMKMEDGTALERAAFTMAISVIFHRLSKLQSDDLEEIYTLAKELPKAQSEEEVEAIRSAMLEILDQKHSGVRAFELASQTPEKLQKWINYVASKVLELRKAAGMTQMELAEKTGLPQSH